MAWLFVRAAPVEVEVVEGVPVVDENVSTRVAIDIFGTDPMAQAGLLIELRGLLVSSLVGSDAFFLAVPNQSGPYLARMLPETVADGGVVEANATVTVTGRVYAMTDSVKDAWVADGTVAEGDRIVLDFADSFFEAEEVMVNAPPQPEDN